MVKCRDCKHIKPGMKKHGRCLWPVPDWLRFSVHISNLVSLDDGRECPVFEKAEGETKQITDEMADQLIQAIEKHIPNEQ